MTPLVAADRETADRIVEPYRRSLGTRAGLDPMAAGNLVRAIARALATARAEEREVCADLADQHNSCEGIAQKIADAIRARGAP